MHASLALILLGALGVSEAVECPDKESSCPDGYTCCLMQGGEYGCCDLPNAVCCEDRLHCCPHGTHCASSGTSCLNSDGSHHSHKRAKAPLRARGDGEEAAVECPDHRTQCPSGTTCCSLGTGKGYGCCPMPNAVCCSDHVHCCPSGTQCDVAHSACTRSDGEELLPWLNKVSAYVLRRPNQSASSSFACGRRGKCTGRGTCCGGEKCCPFEAGQCCESGEFCCPKGWRCRPDSAQCVRNGFAFRWMPTQRVEEEEEQRDAQRQRCGDGSECGAAETCCPSSLHPNHFDCCHMPNARCCDDYCCPEGFTCSAYHRGRCVRSTFRRP